MKNYLSLFAGLGLLLAGCGGADDKTNDPTPAGPHSITLRLTQVGSKSATAFLRNTSLRDNTPTMLQQYNIDPGTVTKPGGTFASGQTVVLAIVYDKGGLPGYVRPTAGQYLQGEVLEDGKVKATVRLDPASFDNQALYWQETPPSDGRHLIDEVSVKF